MTTEKNKTAQTQPVGSVWELPGRGEVVVIDPNGVDHKTSGAYVLDMPGVFRCGDTEMEAKA